MSEVKFQFQLQCSGHPEQNFSLSSDGSTLLYSGKDRDGKQLELDFQIPREIIGAARKQVEPILKETCDFDLSQTSDDGFFWTVKYNIGGVNIRYDGYLEAREDLERLKAATTALLDYIGEDPEIAMADPNLQTLKKLVEQAAVFAG